MLYALGVIGYLGGLLVAWYYDQFEERHRLGFVGFGIAMLAASLLVAEASFKPAFLGVAALMVVGIGAVELLRRLRR